MSKDLYVKNIPVEATEEDLRRLFAVSGKVTYVHMVKNPQTGDFLGCAYVKMSSEAEARDAILSLDGARFINREISVSVALPQRPAGAAKNKPVATGPKAAAPKAGSPKAGPAAAGPRSGFAGSRSATERNRPPQRPGAGPSRGMGKGPGRKSGGRGK